MTSFARHIKLAPVLLLALLAVGTSLQIGCSGTSEGTGTGDDALNENPSDPGCSGYGYGYGSCSGGYGYGYGYGR